MSREEAWKIKRLPFNSIRDVFFPPPLHDLFNIPDHMTPGSYGSTIVTNQWPLSQAFLTDCGSQVELTVFLYKSVCRVPGHYLLNFSLAYASHWKYLKYLLTLRKVEFSGKPFLMRCLGDSCLINE